MPTANPLSTSGIAMDRITADSTAANRLLNLELALCDRPEYADAGEHLIVVGLKR